MRASNLMLLAIAAGVIGRWSHNEKAIPSAQGVIEVLFAFVLISALDQGKTSPIARGFALLFLAAILLSDNSPLTGLAKSESSPGTFKPNQGSILGDITKVASTKK